MIQSVAFIGLGAMGYRMAAHLPSILRQSMSGTVLSPRLKNMLLNMTHRLLHWNRQFRQILFFMPADQCRC